VVGAVDTTIIVRPINRVACRFVEKAVKNRHFPGVGAVPGLVVPCAGRSNQL
jgi:hypothetical protein